MPDRPATPKQIAYLSYMGVINASSINIQEASDSIENLFKVEDQTRWSWLFERQSNWHTDRFLLYPDLYRSQLKDYLNNEFAQTLHDYVRSRVTGASEKLTKAKIKRVIKDLTREDEDWWSTTDRKEAFFRRLEVIFPACCDGRAPVKSFRQESLSRSIPAENFETTQSSRRVSLTLPLTLLSTAFLIGISWVILGAFRRVQSDDETRTKSPILEQKAISNTKVSAGTTVSPAEAKTLTGRHARMRILSLGPYGVAGLIGIEDGPVQTPAVIADLLNKQKDETWQGTVYPCGTHRFIDTGRTVARYATNPETAEALNRQTQ